MSDDQLEAIRKKISDWREEDLVIYRRARRWEIAFVIVAVLVTAFVLSLFLTGLPVSW